MSATLHALIAQRQDLVAGAQHLREGFILQDSSAYGEALRGIDLFDAKHQADPVYAEWLKLDQALRTVQLNRTLLIGDYDSARLDASQRELDAFMADHPPTPDDRPEAPQDNPTPSF